MNKKIFNRKCVVRNQLTVMHFLFGKTYILSQYDEIQASEEREWYQLNINFCVPDFFIDKFKKHGFPTEHSVDQM